MLMLRHMLILLYYWRQKCRWFLLTNFKCIHRVDIGTKEPLILDVLINALTQISSEYAPQIPISSLYLCSPFLLLTIQIHRVEGSHVISSMGISRD